MNPVAKFLVLLSCLINSLGYTVSKYDKRKEINTDSNGIEGEYKVNFQNVRFK